MIKILCCEHAVQKLINEGRFFKFVLELNCDCDFHEQINVLKCLQNEFFVKTNVKLKKECTCKDQFTCCFLFIKTLYVEPYGLQSLYQK